MRLDHVGELLGRHPALLAVAVLQRRDGGRQRNGAVGILADEISQVLERLCERGEDAVGNARSRAPAPPCCVCGWLSPGGCRGALSSMSGLTVFVVGGCAGHEARTRQRMTSVM